ncbi:hypothetical protein Nepgr_000568 [Nepenthes gracilis]|uniref:Uncharacterized protein n=1 Tax=Nepenthes gracilis TaxID=150966 RepID=A0AAD3RWB4_NEPGR|nr:hypothetical protein Nepgr_000568 [Nepenthes gracilis]
MGTWSALATCPKIRVKMSSSSDSFSDKSFSDETSGLVRALSFQFQALQFAFRETKSLSSRKPHPPVTYSTNRRSISMMRMRRREDKDPTSSQTFL